MLVEFSRLWPWLLACFAIGAAAGALTRRAPENGIVARWLVWTALAFGVGVLLVRLGALDAAAPLVEGALAAYAVLMIGAALGALARHRSIWAHEGWAVGLVAASLLWVGAVVIGQSDGEEGRRFAAPTKSAGADMPARDVAACRRNANRRRDHIARPRARAERASHGCIGGMTLADCQSGARSLFDARRTGLSQRQRATHAVVDARARQGGDDHSPVPGKRDDRGQGPRSRFGRESAQ